MVTRVKPEGWTDIQEFDWVGRKLGGQLSNLLACQVDKALDNLAVHNKQAEYKIAVLDAKIQQIKASSTKYQSNGKEEVPLNNH